eukprot:scaffold199631_cov37-Tisochrysis_lutea.AAC.2
MGKLAFSGTCVCARCVGRYCGTSWSIDNGIEENACSEDLDVLQIRSEKSATSPTAANSPPFIVYCA